MPRTTATLKRIVSAQQRQAKMQAKRGASKSGAILEWYGEALKKSVDKNSRQRLAIAASFLKKQVQQNINRPVLKYKGIRSNRIQVDPESRSKPGEYPKADTTHLRKTIIFEMRKKGSASQEAIVGTPLDYGILLETQMNRSFLRRTLQEELPRIRRILLSGWKL